MSDTLVTGAAVAVDTPLHDVAFTVVDLETTGGAPQTCGITEVGAVRVRGGEREAELSTLVRPDVTIPRQITALTGIDDALVADAPPLTAVLPMLLELWRGSVLVAHSAHFDVSFLDAALRRHGYEPVDLPVICTATLARRLVRDEVPDCRLSTLARHFRTHHDPVHRALPDARATVEVLHALLERASGLGVRTLGELVELCRRDTDAVARRHRLTDGLPRTPGVYAFRSASGEVLYIGRATDLRERVRTYFGSDPRRMVRGLVRETARIDHRTCPTTIEAEIRELRAIAAWRPRFNRRGKPPRTAVWVKLTDERFPRLSIVRRQRDDGGTYLGPLRSSRAAEQVRDALWDVTGIRRCTMRIGRRTAVAACALAEIGRCDAPCTGQLEPAAYDAVADEVRAALTDGSGPVVARLDALMGRLADAGRYDEARWRRDRLRALLDVVRRQRDREALDEVDLLAHRPTGDGRVAVVRLVGGRLAASAVCLPSEVADIAARLDTGVASPGDPFVLTAERGVLARWLGAPDTVVEHASGCWAEPVGGGATVAELSARVRHRTRTGAPADELRRKRVRRAR